MHGSNKILLFSSLWNSNQSLQTFRSSALSRIIISHQSGTHGVYSQLCLKPSTLHYTSTKLRAKFNDMSDSTNNNIKQQKQLLRKKIRSRIRSAYPSSSSSTTSEADVITTKAALSSNSNKVFQRLFRLPQYKSASSIGFFLSMPHGEIQTRQAIQQMVIDGKTLYVPRVGLDFELCDMDLICCEEGATPDGSLFYDNWPKNKWGIPEPPITNTKSAYPGDIDLLIVPGLAFDSSLHRLGQGKGYYDRFIAKMNTGVGKKMSLVGVCLEEQFLEEETIPISDHDFIMDMVLTPSKQV